MATQTISSCQEISKTRATRASTAGVENVREFGIAGVAKKFGSSKLAILARLLHSVHLLILLQREIRQTTLEFLLSRCDCLNKKQIEQRTQPGDSIFATLQ